MNQPEFQFLIGINSEQNDNNNLNISIMEPKYGIDLYFLNDYTIEPSINRQGRPVIIDLGVKICLLNITLLSDLLLNNSISNLRLSTNNNVADNAVDNAVDNAADNAADNVVDNAADNAHTNSADNGHTNEEMINEIQKKSRFPFTMVLNDSGLESPIILSNIIYNKNYNGNIKIYIHNLSPAPYILRKNTSLFKLVIPDLSPTTMKIISIDDLIFLNR